MILKYQPILFIALYHLLNSYDFMNSFEAPLKESNITTLQEVYLLDNFNINQSNEEIKLLNKNSFYAQERVRTKN